MVANPLFARQVRAPVVVALKLKDTAPTELELSGHPLDRFAFFESPSNEGDLRASFIANVRHGVLSDTGRQVLSPAPFNRKALSAFASDLRREENRFSGARSTGGQCSGKLQGRPQGVWHYAQRVQGAHESILHASLTRVRRPLSARACVRAPSARSACCSRA